MNLKQKKTALLDFFTKSGKCTMVDGKAEDTVMIGDVLQIKRTDSQYATDICILWKPLGFTKSLNEILDGEIYYNKEDSLDSEGNSMPFECFEDDNTQKLLDFLWDLRL